MPTVRLIVPLVADDSALLLLLDELPLLLQAVTASTAAMPIAPNAIPALCLACRLPHVIVCPDWYAIAMSPFSRADSSGSNSHLD
jgi:hypothetical protein